MGVDGVGHPLEGVGDGRVVKAQHLGVGHAVVAGDDALAQGDHGGAAGGQMLVKGHGMFGQTALWVGLHNGHRSGLNSVFHHDWAHLQGLEQPGEVRHGIHLLSFRDLSKLYHRTARAYNMNSQMV